MGTGFKIAAACAAVAVSLALFCLAVSPFVSDPERRLAGIAKRVAAGPHSLDDARSIHRDFDRAVKEELPKIAGLPSPEIVARLEKLLPTSAFEVHSVDLPRGLKIVEIDTILQGTNYLMMKSGTSYKVYSLAGLEVFDDARVVSDSAGPMLVVIGHSGGQPPHHPQVKVFALLPNAISDDTDKLLATVQGDGSAHFAKTGADIVLSLSMMSLGHAERLFAPGALSDDDIVHQYLEWKDAHYASRYEYGQGPFSALYAVARCLRYPDLTGTHSNYLGRVGQKLVESFKSPDAGNFSIRRVAFRKNTATYEMSGTVGKFLIGLTKAQGLWSVSSASEAVAGAVPKPVTAAQSTPAVTATSTSANKDPRKVASLSPRQPTSNPSSPSGTAGYAPHPSRQIRTSTGTPQVISSDRQPRKANTYKANSPSAIISADRVNLRLQPSVTSKSITQLAKGSRIGILAKHHDWYQVRCNGQEGFVNCDFVARQKPNSNSKALSRLPHSKDTHNSAVSHGLLPRLANVEPKRKQNNSVKAVNRTETNKGTPANTPILEPQLVP